MLFLSFVVVVVVATVQRISLCTSIFSIISNSKSQLTLYNNNCSIVSIVIVIYLNSLCVCVCVFVVHLYELVCV